MAQVEDLEQRLRDLEDKFEQLQTSLTGGQLGSAQRPVNEIYLREKGRLAVARLTFNDAATPAVRVEKVR